MSLRDERDFRRRLAREQREAERQAEIKDVQAWNRRVEAEVIIAKTRYDDE